MWKVLVTKNGFVGDGWVIGQEELPEVQDQSKAAGGPKH